MKKIFLFLTLSLIFSIASFAQNDDNAVTMVSYEQRWLDQYGTLALKNNTDNPIRYVKFRITYLDMQGNPLDYKDFRATVMIDPGMVKKTDIKAYEHDRFYSYYKSDAYDSNKKFKISFELLDYDKKEGKQKAVPAVRKDHEVPPVNAPRTVSSTSKVEREEGMTAPAALKDEVARHTPASPARHESLVSRQPSVSKTSSREQDRKEEEYVPDEMEEELYEEEEDFVYPEDMAEDNGAYEEEEYDGNDEEAYSLLYLWLFFSLCAVSYIIVCLAALRRKRNAIGWLLLSVLLTPIVGIILLLVAGEKKTVNYYQRNEEQHP